MNERFNDRFKFRIWDKERRSMYYPQDLENDYIEIDCNGELLGYETYGLWVGGINCIPMQCTGLKDKNGTLIYEGDIVKTQFYAEEYQANAKVVWNNDVLCFEVVAFNGVRGTLGICKETEVIGNIYENPELLKGQNG